MKKIIFSLVFLVLWGISVPAQAATDDNSGQLEAIQSQLQQIQAEVANLVRARGGVVISSLSGPLLAGLGQPAAWSISVIGDLAGKTRYAVTWGDEVAQTEEFVNVTANDVTANQQQGDFRHAYRAVGNYTVNFWVKTSSGLVARASLPVNVRAQASISAGSLIMSNVGTAVSQ